MQYFGILGELTFPQYILYMYIKVCVQNIVQIYRNEIQKVPVTRCDSQLVLQKKWQGISQDKNYVTKNKS